MLRRRMPRAADGAPGGATSKPSSSGPRCNLLEHCAVVEVNADHGLVGLGCLGFFLDSDHAITLHLSDSETRRVRHCFQDDLGSLPLFLKALRRGTDVALNQVVAKDDANRGPTGEILRQ